MGELQFDPRDPREGRIGNMAVGFLRICVDRIPTGMPTSRTGWQGRTRTNDRALMLPISSDYRRL